MKKIIMICIFILTLGLVVGCGQKKCEMIDHNDPKLSESMQNFYRDDAKTHAVGESFEAKVIAFDKVLKNDKNHGDIIEYKAIVTVAPLCNTKLNIEDFSFSLNEEATAYFDQYPHMTGDDLLPLVKFGDGVELKVTGIDDMQAYRFVLSFDNAGSKNQLASNYSDEQFDEMIKNISLTIHYNHQKEVLNLKYADDINYYQNIDEIPADRLDLKAILDPSLSNNQVAGYYNDSSWQ